MFLFSYPRLARTSFCITEKPIGEKSITFLTNATGLDCSGLRVTIEYADTHVKRLQDCRLVSIFVSIVITIINYCYGCGPIWPRFYVFSST